MKRIVFVVFLSIFFAGIAGFFLFHKDQEANAAPNDLHGFAWSSNIGWISFNGTNHQVTIAASGSNIDLSGYAWSSNIGWLSFNRANTGNPPNNDIGGGSGAIARINTTNGKLEGWARFLAYGGGWDGWVKFSSTAGEQNYGVTVSGNTLSGNAWGSDVVGWVNFSGVTVDSVAPSVSITPSQSQVTPGSTVNLTWMVSGSVTSCTASGNWSGNKNITGGTEQSPLMSNPQTYTYTITCTGPGGTSAPASAIVSANYVCSGFSLRHGLPPNDKTTDYSFGSHTYPDIKMVLKPSLYTYSDKSTLYVQRAPDCTEAITVELATVPSAGTDTCLNDGLPVGTDYVVRQAVWPYAQICLTGLKPVFANNPAQQTSGFMWPGNNSISFQVRGHRSNPEGSYVISLYAWSDSESSPLDLLYVIDDVLTPNFGEI